MKKRNYSQINNKRAEEEFEQMRRRKNSYKEDLKKKLESNRSTVQRKILNKE